MRHTEEQQPATVLRTASDGEDGVLAIVVVGDQRCIELPRHFANPQAVVFAFVFHEVFAQLLVELPVACACYIAILAWHGQPRHKNKSFG